MIHILYATHARTHTHTCARRHAYFDHWNPPQKQGYPRGMPYAHTAHVNGNGDMPSMHTDLLTQTGMTYMHTDRTDTKHTGLNKQTYAHRPA